MDAPMAAADEAAMAFCNPMGQFLGASSDQFHPLQQMSFAAQQQQSMQQQQIQQSQMMQGFPLEYQLQHQRQQQLLQRQQEKKAHDQQVAEAQAALRAATVKLQAHEAMMAERRQQQPGSSSFEPGEPLKGAGVLPDAAQWKNVGEAVAFMNALNKAASKTYKELLPLKGNLSYSGNRTFEELEE